MSAARRRTSAPAPLAAAYRAAVYVVDLPSGGRGSTRPAGSQLLVRVGRRSRELDRLLAAHGVREWAFVTAFNPRNRNLSDARNAQRLRSLRRALNRPRVLLSGEARADDCSWREASLFIAPIAAGRAMCLGRQFDQYAVVVGRRGRPPRLAWCFDRLIA